MSSTVLQWNIQSLWLWTKTTIIRLLEPEVRIQSNQPWALVDADHHWNARDQSVFVRTMWVSFRSGVLSICICLNCSSKTFRTIECRAFLVLLVIRPSLEWFITLACFFLTAIDTVLSHFVFGTICFYLHCPFQIDGGWRYPSKFESLVSCHCIRVVNSHLICPILNVIMRIPCWRLPYASGRLIFSNRDRMKPFRQMMLSWQFIKRCQNRDVSCTRLSASRFSVLETWNDSMHKNLTNHL